MIGIIFSLLLSVAVNAATEPVVNSAHVRRLVVKKDQIVSVRTALGIATLIQVPDRPTSAIIGDLEAFKLEYLDQGVTIKPLHFGAKTNLYIYTDSQRFNIHLVPAPKEIADYIVYLKNAGSLPPPKLASKIKWRSFGKSDTKDGLTLKVKRLGSTGSGFWLLDFELQSVKKTQIKPEWFWVTQGQGHRPIHSLYLSGVESQPGHPVNGTITLREFDLARRLPLQLEVRAKKKLIVTLPEVTRWLK